MVDDGSRGLHVAKDHGNPKRENGDFMCFMFIFMLIVITILWQNEILMIPNPF